MTTLKSNWWNDRLRGGVRLGAAGEPACCLAKATTLGMALAVGLVCCVAAQAQRTATATATVVNGFVAAITVTDGGLGYYGDAPLVTVSGGGGSGATAIAFVNNGALSQVVVLTAGSGYTSAPEVFLSAPNAFGSFLEARMIPRLTIYGDIGSTNQIQYVEAFGDTSRWTGLTNVVLTSSPYLFYDTISPPGAQRFYQGVVVGGSTRPAAPPNFVLVAAGRFTMGSPPTQQDRGGDEGPQTVTLTHGFFMCQHPVTQGEYVAVMGGNPSQFTGDLNRPVEQVSWIDATNYCARLTAQERSAGRLPAGWAYRLPTEAEWEYAARAGTTTRFSYGDDPGYTQLGNYAWYVANSGNTTHPVGQKQPNPWGLYDMHGNVWEWCLDWYGTYPGGSLTDPVGPGSGSYRVLRGGSWSNVGLYCRSASRFYFTPGFRDIVIGFRAVLAAGQP
jgi:formylglycine-generating enzyme required for sulfatase activity